MKQLSGYELSCGYIQVSKIGEYKVELSKEHNVYHVKCNSTFKTWNCFYTLKEARIEFKKQINLLINNGV